MSTLRVNQISNLNDNGPFEFSTGISIPPGKNISGDGQVLINAVGVITATSFSGDGSNLSFPGFLSTGNVISTAILT